MVQGLKPVLDLICLNSGPIAQKTHYVCDTDTKMLVLLLALISASSQYLTQNTITISGENKPLLSLTECGTNNYHSV